jgi:ABC-type transport system, ATP-binding component
MEKKNNQMVDKEKELKNVAPDTDVAPDVTDASSFQGGPSHTSSNRQQMRLINRIDYYKWKINLLTELISVERENLEKSRDKRTDAYKERQRRKIFPLKLKASDVDEAVEELYGRDIEKFDKRQKLNFREYRQNLRRAEGLLNPDGTLKRFELDAEGNEIPFENVLSAESQELLKAFEVSQAEQRAAFMEGLRVKAVAAVGEETADAEDIYEAARLEDETALESFVAEENAKIEKRMEKYVEATQFKINRYNEKLLSMQEKLAELMAEEEAKFGVELPSDVILRLDRLTMEFGGLKAVNNLSFDVKKGEIFGLIGPNGAGKTTVFNCITQFYKPTGGLIYYRNREDKVIVLNKYQVHDVIKTGIVRTFQNVEVIYELSILDNLLIAAHTQYKSNIFAQMFNTKGVRQEEAVNRKKALKVLEYCGLLDKKDLPPVGLPYGVLKRIELARTLMAGASLIILDEPAAGLNDNETIELAQMIRRIRDEFNVTIFLVEHDMGLVMDICEHICAISFGKKLAYGTPQEIQANPVVQEAYLGTNEVKKEAQNG